MKDIDKINAITTSQMVRIRNLKESQINSTLIDVFFTIGLSNKPTEGELKKIILYIWENFGDLTLKEIDFAFQLWCKRRLDYTGEFYNNFSIAFLEGVIQSYKRYRGQLRSDQFRPYQEASTDRLTPEGEWALTVQDFKQAYDRYLTKKEFFDFGGVKYGFLSSKGLMNVSEKDEELLQRLASQMYQNEQRRKVRDNTLGGFIRLGGTKDQAHEEYRRIILISWWFNTIKINNLNIIDELNKLNK